MADNEDIIKLSDLPSPYNTTPMIPGNTLTIHWANHAVCLEAIERDNTGALLLRCTSGNMAHLRWIIANAVE